MEEWRPVTDYPNYEVSNYGKIRNKHTLQILSQRVRGGYLASALYNNDGRRDIPVHRAEMFAFHNKESDMEVNHIDGNKMNNALENLEYCTRSDNMRHAFRTGLKQPSGGKKPKKVKVVETGDVYTSIWECARSIGGDQRHVSACLSGKRNSHKGLHFESVGDCQ